MAVFGTLNGSTGRIRIERIGNEADDSSIVQCGRQRIIDDHPDRDEQMNKNASRDLGRVSRDLALLLLVVRPRQALGMGIRRAFDAQLASEIRLADFLTSSSRVVFKRRHENFRLRSHSRFLTCGSIGSSCQGGIVFLAPANKSN